MEFQPGICANGTSARHKVEPEVYYGSSAALTHIIMWDRRGCVSSNVVINSSVGFVHT